MRQLLRILLIMAAVITPVMTYSPRPMSLALKQDRAALWVDIHIEGLGTIPMLLDTGASFNLLTQSQITWLLNENRARHVNTVTTSLGDGRQVAGHVYQVDGATIGDCPLQSFQALLMPDLPDAMLGLQALRWVEPVELRLSEGKLILHCRF